MGKATAFGTRIERQDGVGTQRPEAHGRYIENAGAIGLCTLRANGDAEIVRVQSGGGNGVVDPFVTFNMDVQLCTKWSLVDHRLGALIDQRALCARKRCRIVVAFKEILADFRAERFQHEADVSGDGVVAQNRTLGLAQVVHAHRHQGAR